MTATTSETATAVTTAEDFLALACHSNQFAPVALKVPAIGGTVYVRVITAGELDEYADAVRRADEDRKRGTILAFAVGDAAGRRVFPGDPAAHAGQLGKVAAKVADAVVAAFQEANGLADPKAG